VADREARKVRTADGLRILPPAEHGEIWHGSSHEDSWEQTRALIKRRGGLLRAGA
jgi:hypothetical protein